MRTTPGDGSGAHGAKAVPVVALGDVRYAPTPQYGDQSQGQQG